MSEPAYAPLSLDAEDVGTMHQALLVGWAVCQSTKHLSCAEQVKEALDRLRELGVPDDPESAPS